MKNGKFSIFCSLRKSSQFSSSDVWLSSSTLLVVKETKGPANANCNLSNEMEFQWYYQPWVLQFLISVVTFVKDTTINNVYLATASCSISLPHCVAGVGCSFSAKQPLSNTHIVLQQMWLYDCYFLWLYPMLH